MRADVDVVIVGGGVVGCAIAHALSFSHARVALLEAAHDLCEGASKGNTGIATSGGDCPPGTLEADLVRRSSPRWEELCATLDTPFRRIGTLAAAFDEDEEARLPELRDEALEVGAPVEILSGEAARALEPLLSDRVRAALHFPQDGIVDSIRLTLGYAELAARNGVRVRTGSPVTGFELDGDAIAAVRVPDGLLTTRCVVNAAGLGADTVAELAGGEAPRMWPRQGQYWLLDRAVGARFSKVVGGVPTPHTRGVYAVPTTNGTLLLGPTADDRDDRTDRSVDAVTLDRVFAAAQKLVPELRRDQAIKTFAANRPASERVYRIERDPHLANMVHATGIRSTGVSSSPATAELVRDLVAEVVPEAGSHRDGAIAALPALPRLLAHPQPERLLAADPRYGQVVCACEQVTAAEIAAVHGYLLPPRSLEGLRKRTRAMGGRCQGALCLAGCSFMHSLLAERRPGQVAVSEPAATLGVEP
jgi:glycerol-3-phosphate dehydrogenase